MAAVQLGMGLSFTARHQLEKQLFTAPGDGITIGETA